MNKYNIGKEWAEALNLKQVQLGDEERYHTSWGIKSALGIYEMVKRLVEGEEEMI